MAGWRLSEGHASKGWLLWQPPVYLGAPGELRPLCPVQHAVLIAVCFGPLLAMDGLSAAATAG